MRIAADHLDLEARHAALADLVERARDAVHAADAVGHERDAHRLAAARGEPPLLAPEERRGGRVGDRRHARLEQLERGAAAGRPARPPAGPPARPRPPSACRPRPPSLRSWQRRARRCRPAWEKSSAWRWAIRSPSGRSSSTAASHARSSARASSGPRSAAGARRRLAAAAVGLAHHALDDPQHRARVGRRAGGAAAERPHARAPSRCAPSGRRCRGRRAPARARRARARGTPPGRRRRRLGVRAPDVDAGVVVGAADPDPAVRLDVDRGRQVELGVARAVAHLPDAEQLGEPAAVARGERRRDGEERVRQRARDLVLVQIAGDRPRRRRGAPAATRGRPA